MIVTQFCQHVPDCSFRKDKQDVGVEQSPKQQNLVKVNCDNIASTHFYDALGYFERYAHPFWYDKNVLGIFTMYKSSSYADGNSNDRVHLYNSGILLKANPNNTHLQLCVFSGLQYHKL